jgi:hypothetical protein
VSTSMDFPIPLAPWIKVAEFLFLRHFGFNLLVVGLSPSPSPSSSPSSSSSSPLQTVNFWRADKIVCISSSRPTFFTAVKSSLTELKSLMLVAGGWWFVKSWDLSICFSLTLTESSSLRSLYSLLSVDAASLVRSLVVAVCSVPVVYSPLPSLLWAVSQTFEFLALSSSSSVTTEMQREGGAVRGGRR